jgi:probable F420-dependent oxidoreductase
MALTDRARFGFAIPQIFVDGPIDMGLARAVVTRADALGYDSLWTQEQMIGRAPNLEPVALLSYVAALTARARLGVSVIVFPLRNPVELAKSLSSLDRMSGGRLTVGNGLGPAGERYTAFGVPEERRVARFNEGLAVMRALWSDAEARHEGDFWPLDGVAMEPKPVQSPLPVWFGGSHPDSLRRAVRRGDGWMGAGSSTIDSFRGRVEQLRQFLAEAGRDPATLPISKRLYIALDDDADRAERRLRDWFRVYYRSDELASRVSVWGTREHCAERIAEVLDAGAEMVLLNPVFDHQEHLEGLAEIVGLK